MATGLEIVGGIVAVSQLINGLHNLGQSISGLQGKLRGHETQLESLTKVLEPIQRSKSFEQNEQVQRVLRDIDTDIAVMLKLTKKGLAKVDFGQHRVTLRIPSYPAQSSTPHQPASQPPPHKQRRSFPATSLHKLKRLTGSVRLKATTIENDLEEKFKALDTAKFNLIILLTFEQNQRLAEFQPEWKRGDPNIPLTAFCIEAYKGTHFNTHCLHKHRSSSYEPLDERDSRLLQALQFLATNYPTATTLDVDAIMGPSTSPPSPDLCAIDRMVLDEPSPRVHPRQSGQGNAVINLPLLSTLLTANCYEGSSPTVAAEPTSALQTANCYEGSSPTGAAEPTSTSPNTNGTTQTNAVTKVKMGDNGALIAAVNTEASHLPLSVSDSTFGERGIMFVGSNLSDAVMLQLVSRRPQYSATPRRAPRGGISRRRNLRRAGQ
ncbi:hypothetical protein MKZ38_004659 [Zalerion maritima]|uniref:Uncharacterized protein n=1 Tax=Zalerion maritima TaxID=339359 RepID=A0AAD5WQW7_9PEZI|nr:hypothetical protein MKZ38_004659 [Zalerion maritima]